MKILKKSFISSDTNSSIIAAAFCQLYNYNQIYVKIFVFLYFLYIEKICLNRRKIR